MSPRRRYLGFIDGMFRAWVLCPTCHARVFLPVGQAGQEPVREQICQCGATVDVPADLALEPDNSKQNGRLA
jgi:hypothetical protein